MSNEKIKPLVTADKSFSPKLAWRNESRIRLTLRQEFATYTPNNVVNVFVVYELDRWSQDLNAKFTLKDCLFRAVKLTKNANRNKYSYSGYGIGFESCSISSIQNFHWSKNVIIFRVDMSSSMHANNKIKKYFNSCKG